MDEPCRTGHLLLTSAEMAATDRAAATAGLPVEALMEAAGRAVANAAHRLLRPGAPVAVLCGPGNNGGDAYVAARLLAARGVEVRLHAARPPLPDGAAARAADAWGAGAQPWSSFDPAACGLIIDGLYGAGLTRAIAGEEAEAIERVNAADAPVLAIDVPSGLDADTGLPLWPAIEADATVTFFRRKPGHLLWPGRALCGAVEVAQIGLDEAHLAVAACPSAFHNAPGLWRDLIPTPARAGHKYDRGHVLVVSGGEFQTGASRLSAMAALNGGAGAVTIAGDAGALRIHAAHLTAVMLREAPSPASLAELVASGRFSSCVIGPAAGVGAGTAARIEAIAAAGLLCVLDADAITSLAAVQAPFPAPHHGPWVLTPHAGEFQRLFGARLMLDTAYAALPERLRASKLEQARAAARLAEGVIVFKGVDTVIASPCGRAAINDNAGPELATAGTGDVLAGLIATHLAQGMPAFEAACAAVWLHGACGAAYGAGLTAERLVEITRPLAAWLVDGAGSR